MSSSPGSDIKSTQDLLDDHGLGKILNVISALIDHARDRLRQSLRASFPNREDLPFDLEHIERELFFHNVGSLLALLNRTLVLELHVARLEGVLEGDTPEERFEHFINRMRQPDHLQRLFDEYPVLEQQVKTNLDQWVESSLELLHRVYADWDHIQSVFGGGEPLGKLESISRSMGDRHRNGRTVRFVRFSSGLQLVYKPRSQAVAVEFNNLLSWINERGTHPPFRILKVLDQGTHGWVEFVSPQGCTSVDELKRFYTRQGGYLALLYMLGATDMHAENLIAVGEHPMMIDLEALFHPQVAEVSDAHIGHLGYRSLKNSVAEIGLLPHRSFSAASEGIDLSGLGAPESQLTPFGVPRWEGAGTDEMRVVLKTGEINIGSHRPTLNEGRVEVLDYIEDIAHGFSDLYGLLERHKTELLDPAGPLAVFAENEIRAILRPTQTYSSLLSVSLHPDLMRDAVKREGFLDQLEGEIEYRPYLAGVVEAEREDLRRGDIPLFTTRPNTRSVWTSLGQEIPDYLAESSMAVVEQRVRNLGPTDLERQLWLVKATLSTLAEPSQSHPVSRLTPAVRREATRRDLLRFAEQVGDRLELLAIQNGDEATWLTLKSISDRHTTLGSVELDLYNGVPGIILFLAHLGEVIQADRFTELARAGLTNLRKQMQVAEPTDFVIGGFSGWGGLIYTLVQLSLLWKEPDLLAEAETLVEDLPSLIETDEQLDIISGSAGCILALSLLYRSTASPQVLKVAIRCGERLLVTARSMPEGIGWPTVGGEGAPPLAGFSHGAAGIACALLELADLTGEEQFRTAAEDAIRYERSLYSSEHRNWPDLRHPDREATYMAAWCHGAPGIGQGRLHALHYLEDDLIRGEITTAVETTCAIGFGGNHSMCHGDLGNLDLLLEAGRLLDEEAWQNRATEYAGAILHSIETQGWRCGTTLETEVPGLMTGISGIGYQLLRLAEPARVPSVLMLASLDAPPHESSQFRTERTLLAV